VQTVRATDGVAFVGDRTTSADGAISVFAAYPTTSPQSPATEHLVRELRDDLPSSVHVGGETASNVDFASFMAERLPWFIGAVLSSASSSCSPCSAACSCAQGRGVEPRVHRCCLRRNGRRLPVGLVQLGPAHRTGAYRTSGHR
jgi:hypothetical protein